MRWGRSILLAVVGLLILAGSTVGAPTPTHVHFTAAGDYGTSATTTSGVLNALATGGSDAHFALGDMSYGTTGAEASWCDFVKARVGDKFPFELLAGNHEGNGQNGNINDFSACLPNQLPGVVGTYGRQYYVDVPQVDPLVRYVMISPNIVFPAGVTNYPAGSANYNWTASAIDGARSADIPWVVVGMHKPCVSMGEYACDPGADLMNMLISRKVDLVLSGHEHLYQRSKQLALGTGCAALTIGSYNPSCVVDSDDSAKKGAGTVLATIGTGGVALRDVNLSDPEAGYFAASSGANRNPTHGYADFDVTPDQLTMQFVRGAGGTFSDSFTLTRDDTPANQPPVAAFTSSSSGLTASFDGSLSSDSDGEIVSYAWDFGPATGTGAKPDYTYATGGTYPVKLTVTDSAGATDVVTRDVTVSGPATNTLASDDFERTLSAAWGTADVGGAWTLRGQASRFSVSSGAGKIQVPDGATLSADLNAVSSSSTRMTAEFSVDKLLEGASIALVGRQTGTDAQRYIARLKLQADGKSLLYLMRPSATALQYKPTVTFVPGERYKLSLEVKGTNPTTLSTKVWKASDPEPAAWLGTTTDAAAGMQTAGRVGVYGYLSAGAGGPVNMSIHQLTVIKAN